MSRVVLTLALACLGFTAAPAEAQLFRRSAPCPTCPNGVCQPQPSGPMFEAVPTVLPKSLPAAPCPCTATNCTQGAPCPCTAGNCTCAPASAILLSPAGSCTAAPSRGASGEAWRPGCRVARFVNAHRPHLIFR